MTTYLTSRLGDARLFYQMTGDGPPLVLLHGLSGSARWWAKNIPVLARRFRVYAPDWIGFGRSRGQAFRLEAAAGLLHDWTAVLGMPSFTLVGHSMGGYIAASLAAHFPEQVQRLALVDAAALPLGRRLPRAVLSLAHALVYMRPDFLPVLLADSLRAGPLTLLRAGREVLAVDLTVDLERISAPTLVIWGQHDPILPLALGRRLHAALPGARWALIPGAGHNPMWDRPVLFNRVLMGFLQPSPSDDPDKQLR